MGAEEQSVCLLGYGSRSAEVPRVVVVVVVMVVMVVVRLRVQGRCSTLGGEGGGV